MTGVSHRRILIVRPYLNARPWCVQLRIRGKNDVEKSTNFSNFSSSQGSDLATSAPYMRSSDGLGADGELTPSTKKTALEAMRKVLNRAEYTPRTPRNFDDKDMEIEAEERQGSFWGWQGCVFEPSTRTLCLWILFGRFIGSSTGSPENAPN